ncbi:MAG: transposon-transfer assisting family protein [Ruminococcus sp.]|nr:transposon-transfer assisting family protein [Ruminococcus sp.]
MIFTVEETNFMSYFDTSSREALISDMQTTVLSDMDEETTEMLCRMVKRLEKMTDEEFDALYIAPDFLIED